MLYICVYRQSVYMQLLNLETNEHNFGHWMSSLKIRFYSYIIYIWKLLLVLSAALDNVLCHQYFSLSNPEQYRIYYYVRSGKQTFRLSADFLVVTLACMDDVKTQIMMEIQEIPRLNTIFYIKWQQIKNPRSTIIQRTFYYKWNLASLKETTHLLIYI